MTGHEQILNNQRGGSFLGTMAIIVILSLIFMGYVKVDTQSNMNYTADAVVTLDDGTKYRPLVKLPGEGEISGVASGIAYKLGVDPWLVRGGFMVGAVFFGFGVIPYVFLYFFLENAETPDDYLQRVSGTAQKVKALAPGSP